MTKTKDLVMCFASFPTPCRYGQAEHSFLYAQFDAHGGRIVFPFPASLVERTGAVGYARFLVLCSSDSVMSLSAVKKSARIDWGHYAGDELPFFGYTFNMWGVSDVVTTRTH